MKLYISLVLACLALAACDPAYIRRDSIDSARAVMPIDSVLGELDQVALQNGFYRAQASDETAESLPSKERLIAWYDTQRSVSHSRGSFVYLKIKQNTESNRLFLEAVAFPSFSGPPNLKQLRQDVTKILCSKSFDVDKGCGG